MTTEPNHQTEPAPSGTADRPTMGQVFRTACVGALKTALVAGILMGMLGAATMMFMTTAIPREDDWLSGIIGRQWAVRVWGIIDFALMGAMLGAMLAFPIELVRALVQRHQQAPS